MDTEEQSEAALVTYDIQMRGLFPEVSDLVSLIYSSEVSDLIFKNKQKNNNIFLKQF